MINENELRRGNWVNFNNGLEDINVQVIEVRSQGVAEEFNPIPLTSEILIVCGFKWETENKRHLQKEISSDKRMTFYFDNGEMNSLQLYEDGYFDGFFSMDTVKYLHQLQNLYFALTGEELPVNFKDLTYQ